MKIPFLEIIRWAFQGALAFVALNGVINFYLGKALIAPPWAAIVGFVVTFVYFWRYR